MAKKSDFEKGYLEGQLDSAESELYMLYRIKEQMGQEPHENDAIIIRIRETEDFLRKNGRDVDASDYDIVYDED
ncbi:hypothetical protein L8C07_05865 [Paenibacillus sp. CMAA1739]|uniref:hypothetical protein n=1 Tax=Paenibacillus ottowii TaxID=2315729 RepID=UPI002DB61E11|nr:hypothetical protein [Paenibacillus sp. CMAA1739]MEC4565465.1 hypothetical protein [Paenibacillus sp. CMAA1739]